MKLIAAVDEDNNIGYNGKLLFHLPDDMKFFRQETTGKVVVMGRKTLESFPGKSPLKNRTNIVLSRDINYSPDGCISVHSLEELLDVLKEFKSDEVYVIGGADIYSKLLPYCSTALITKVLTVAEKADKKFPELDSLWTLSYESPVYINNGIPFKFTTYIKNGGTFDEN